MGAPRKFKPRAGTQGRQTGKAPYVSQAKPKLDESLRLKLYTPQDWQRTLHESQARFRVAVVGRRAGKTTAGINETAKYSWEHVEDPSWWVAPTHAQTARVFRVFCKHFETAIASKRASVGQMEIRWKSGGLTEFKSAERYDNLRGEGVGFLVLDEFAQMPRDAWMSVLRATLSDTLGRTLFIGTPRGKNWAYALFRRGESERPEDADWESFSFPTSASIYIPQSEIDDAQAILPVDVFNQEYMADFLDEAAGVFHGVAGCIHGDLADEPDPAGHHYVLGVDWAKHTDFTVITVMDTDAIRDSQVTPHVVRMERLNVLNYVVQMDRVEQIAKKYNAQAILVDSTGIGEPLHDGLAMRGLPVYPYHLSGMRKTQLIQSLSVAIQSKAISFPELPVLLSELSSYQYTMSPSGTIVYAAPVGDHDDTVISLALAVWAAQHPVWTPEARFVVEDSSDWSISPI